MYKRVTIPLNGIYPKIFVNTPQSVFTVRNDSVNIPLKTYNRLMFVCCDESGQAVSASHVDRQIDRGVFCPQGFDVYKIHIGYTVITDIPLEKLAIHEASQLMQIARPFILGFVIKDVKTNETFYMECGRHTQTALKCAYNSSITDHQTRNVHEFHTQPNTPQNEYMGFHNASMHTFIDATANSFMLIFKKWSPSKHIGWRRSDQDIKLVGAVYMNKYDLLPTFIYGNTYDELTLRTPIKASSTDIFTYSQTVADQLGMRTRFIQALSNLIYTIYPQQNTQSEYLSFSDIVKIRINFTPVLQGTIPLFDKQAFGMFDTPMLFVCGQSLYGFNDECGCLNIQFGQICDVNNQRCQQKGYKTKQQMSSECIQSNANINIQQQIQVNQQTAGGSIQTGKVSFGQFLSFETIKSYLGL